MISKGYAVYQELTLQNQETRVFQGYFEKVKAGTYQPWAKSWARGETRSSSLTKAAEIENKRQALPGYHQSENDHYKAKHGIFFHHLEHK